MPEKTIYGTPLICGTIKSLDKPTYLGDIYQTILVYRAHTRWGGKRLPFAWSNIANLIENYCIEHGIQPIAHAPDGYCTLMTEYNEHTWQVIFDFQLHDAAVTYNSYDNHEQLTREDNRHGFNLWCWSRQLRQHYARDEAERSTLRSVREGWKLQPREYLLGYLRSLRWYGRNKVYCPARRWLRDMRGAA